ncbi:unnamed protein product [Dovyalis caffra]|uniref:Uncharacterized protein n=1 Tax=Dovyalis caffra TaxID=77055 RepID=A0AAV1S2V7_9ROSI|nr:unnamed protein product [Dovyalis caffra]
MENVSISGQDNRVLELSNRPGHVRAAPTKEIHGIKSYLPHFHTPKSISLTYRPPPPPP